MAQAAMPFRWRSSRMQPRLRIVATSAASNRTPYWASAAMTSSMWRRLSQLAHGRRAGLVRQHADGLAQERANSSSSFMTIPIRCSWTSGKAIERARRSALSCERSAEDLAAHRRGPALGLEAVLAERRQHPALDAEADAAGGGGRAVGASAMPKRSPKNWPCRLIEPQASPRGAPSAAGSIGSMISFLTSCARCQKVRAADTVAKNGSLAVSIRHSRSSSAASSPITGRTRLRHSATCSSLPTNTSSRTLNSHRRSRPARLRNS